MTKKDCASCVFFIRHYDVFGQREKDYGKCEKINEKNVRVKEGHVCKKWSKS